MDKTTDSRVSSERSSGAEVAHKTDIHSLTAGDFVVAAAFTLPAIMSTAIPESTHIPIKLRLLLLFSASFPLLFNIIYSPKSYFAVQRALLIWFCVILVLIVAGLVDKSNADAGVYACYDYTGCWWKNSNCELFFIMIGLFFLVASVLAVFALLVTSIESATPSQSTAILTFIASIFTIWLVSPISLVPTSLLHALRPLHTVVSTSLISFALSSHDPVSAWFERVLGLISLLLAVLNTWSFAQFEGTFIFICGLSGSFCYLFVVLMTIFDILNAIEKSRKKDLSPVFELENSDRSCGRGK